jgi:putative oxidoreductase
MKKLIKLDFIPINNDLGLLLIRVWFCISLFVKHGIEKVFHYSDMLTKFPDPIHVGPTVGLTFAMIADFVCTLLIIIGLGTRLSALFMVINLLVIFIFMHQFSFMDGHAELVYVYLGLAIFIVIAGPGKYSLDNKIL